MLNYYDVTTGQARLCEALKGARDRLVAAWLEGFRASATRIPGSFDEGAMSSLARPMFESLAGGEILFSVFTAVIGAIALLLAIRLVAPARV